MESIERLEISERSAILLGCATVAAVDGELHDGETAILQKLDSGDDKEDWNVAMELFNQLNSQQITLSDVVDLVNRSLNNEQKAVTFVNMIDICLADQTYVISEQDLINVYAKKFGLSANFFKTTIEIIMIKNKINIFDYEG